MLLVIKRIAHAFTTSLAEMSSLYSFSDNDKTGHNAPVHCRCAGSCEHKATTKVCACGGTCSNCRYQQNPFGNPLPFSTTRPGAQPLPAPHVFPPEAAMWRGTSGQIDPGLLFHRVPDPTRMGRPAIGMPAPKDPAAYVYPDFAGASLYPPSCY